MPLHLLILMGKLFCLPARVSQLVRKLLYFVKVLITFSQQLLLPLHDHFFGLLQLQAFIASQVRFLFALVQQFLQIYIGLGQLGPVKSELCNPIFQNFFFMVFLVAYLIVKFFVFRPQFFLNFHKLLYNVVEFFIFELESFKSFPIALRKNSEALDFRRPILLSFFIENNPPVVSNSIYIQHLRSHFLLRVKQVAFPVSVCNFILLINTIGISLLRFMAQGKERFGCIQSYSLAQILYFSLKISFQLLLPAHLAF